MSIKNMIKWMAAKSATGTADLLRELEKKRELEGRKGYAIWHMEHDQYLFMDGGHIGWDTADFYLISEGDMKVLQELLWTRWKADMDVTERQGDLYHVVSGAVDKIQVIPCVRYEGKEPPKLDFINAFRFDGAER